jgi:hypothetical protein
MTESLFSLNAESIGLAIPELLGGLLAGFCLMFCREIAANEYKLQDPKFPPEDKIEIETAQTALFWLGVMVFGSILFVLLIEGNSIIIGAVSIAAGLALGACTERVIWLASRNSRENDEAQRHRLRYLISFRWLL